jgi:hypothetical protein
MLFVERHYLRKHSMHLPSSYGFVAERVPDASFAENFYGLRRRRRPVVEMPRARLATGTAPLEERLRGREIGRSLFWLVSY